MGIDSDSVYRKQERQLWIENAEIYETTGP